VSNPFDSRTANIAGIVYRYSLRNGSCGGGTSRPSRNSWMCPAIGWRWIRVPIEQIRSQCTHFVYHQPGNRSNFIPGATGRTSLGVANAGQAFVHWEPAVLPVGPRQHRTPDRVICPSITVSITVTAPLRISRPALAVLTCARDTILTLSATLAGGIWSGVGITNPQTGPFPATSDFSHRRFSGGDGAAMQ